MVEDFVGKSYSCAILVFEEFNSFLITIARYKNRIESKSMLYKEIRNTSCLLQIRHEVSVEAHPTKPHEALKAG